MPSRVVLARPRGLIVLLVVVALLGASCTGTTSGVDDGGTRIESRSEQSTTSSNAGSGSPQGDDTEGSGPSALTNMDNPEFPPPLVDTAQIVSGGPPPDGIPSIDDPTFLDVSNNRELLPASEAVVSLEINGDARAYPIRAMVWHEIVNDVVGGVPVTVTYCPLCNSAASYERTIDGVVTTFGTSGRLFASALVMYDRATESLWTHFDGKAVVGVRTGTELVSHASPLLSWGEFLDSYPEGKVLDWNAAGFTRDYGRNPYSGYDTPDNEPFLFRGALDDRAAAMQRVVGIGTGAEAIAFTNDAVSGGVAKVTEVQEPSVVIFWVTGQASALEDRSVAGGRDVGSVGVFEPTVADERVAFDVDDGIIVDVGTGSSWSVTGRAISGPLEGTQLVSIPHLDTFWFAWSTYQPETTLVDS